MADAERESAPAHSSEGDSPAAPPSPLPAPPSQGPSFEDHLSLPLHVSESLLGCPLPQGPLRSPNLKSPSSPLSAQQWLLPCW